jgi:hypothetical protein
MTRSLCLPRSLAAAPPHSAAFWREITQNKYVVSAGSDLALTDELVDVLASHDPELRDEIPYSTLTNWIDRTRVIEPAARRRVVDRLLSNLKDSGVNAEPTAACGALFRA